MSSCEHLKAVASQFKFLCENCPFDEEVRNLMDEAFEQGKIFQDHVEVRLTENFVFTETVSFAISEVFMISLKVRAKCKICPNREAEMDLIKRQFKLVN